MTDGPRYKEGDRVVYHDFIGQGTVKEVQTKTTYEYVVEWDDGAPTDTYKDDQLVGEIEA